MWVQLVAATSLRIPGPEGMTDGEATIAHAALSDIAPEGLLHSLIDDPPATNSPNPSTAPPKPPAMSGRKPTRCRYAPPSVEAGMAATAMTATVAPAERGESSSTSWSFCVVMISAPAMTNIPPTAASTPPVNMRERKMSNVSSGSARRRWRRTKRIAPATVATIAPARSAALWVFAACLMAMVRPDRVIRA